MDSEEKKSKRPRIGERRANPDFQDSRQNPYPAPTDRPNSDNDNAAGGEYHEGRSNYRPHYQPRPSYNSGPRPGGYNRYNNNQQNDGYAPRRSYNPQPQQAAPEGGEGAPEGNASDAPTNPGYTPRYQQGGYNNNRQGGYNNNRQGGYNNNRQGGYNNNRQGGYNNNRQGGYGNNNNRQGGYSNNNNRQGGYGNNNNRQGGYNNNRQGGYGNNNNRQGGYGNNNRQGGYNNRQPNNRRQQPRQNQYGMPQGGKSFTPRPKRIEYEMPLPDPNEQIRLNKFMANAGICSRREADEFIQQGLVTVNGNVVTELGTKITHSDTVEYDGKVVTLESKCYVLLNKPKDCVTTSDDPGDRLTVMDLVKGACEERIYPVGRLDRNTTGVLLLTNDGDLASKLTHPKYVKKKIYHVWCDKDITEDDMQRIADGIELDDGPIHADAISYATETDRNQAGIEIHSGRNRIVRRIFESLGYHVTKLDRVYFAGLTKKNLPRGRWRYLTQEEVNFLKMGSFE